MTNLHLPSHFIRYVLSLMAPRQMFFTSSSLFTTRVAYKGLPQGSSLSPTLFNLYMLSLADVQPPIKTLFFADDIILYCSDKKATRAASRVTQSLLKLKSTLSNSLRLELSVKKCVSLVFTYRPHNPSHSVIYFEGSQIPITSQHKYLGTLLDSGLTWSSHIQNIRSLFLGPKHYKIPLVNSVGGRPHDTCDVLQIFYP
jgi:hypothetical protein